MEEKSLFQIKFHKFLLASIKPSPLFKPLLRSLNILAEGSPQKSHGSKFAHLQRDEKYKQKKCTEFWQKSYPWKWHPQLQLQW